MIISLLVFAAMTVCFCFKKIPMASTAMMGMLVLILTGSVTPAQAISSIGNSTTLTIASMLIVSYSLTQTQLISNLSTLVNRVSKGSFTKVLAGYVLITFVIAQFIPSITAVFALVSPIAGAMCEEIEEKQSKIMYPLALTTMVTAYTITPLGPYAANFVENNGYLAQFGISGFTNTPFTEVICKLPPTIFVILWAIFISPKFTKNIEGSVLNKSYNKSFTEKEKLSSAKEKLIYVVASVVFASLIFKSFGQPTWVVPAIGATLLTVCGTISEKEAIQHMGLDIILLYAGVSSLGIAFSNTGAGQLIGKTVLELLGNTKNSYILGFTFFTLSFLMTSVIYNRAVSKILIPILLSTAATLGCDPRGLMQMCYIGSMCSLLTPMASSVVPMMMKCGGYTQKDLIKIGWLPSVFLCIITVFFGMTIYPCF